MVGAHLLDVSETDKQEIGSCLSARRASDFDPLGGKKMASRAALAEIRFSNRAPFAIECAYSLLAMDGAIDEFELTSFRKKIRYIFSTRCIAENVIRRDRFTNSFSRQ